MKKLTAILLVIVCMMVCATAIAQTDNCTPQQEECVEDTGSKEVKTVTLKVLPIDRTYQNKTSIEMAEGINFENPSPEDRERLKEIMRIFGGQAVPPAKEANDTGLERVKRIYAPDSVIRSPYNQ